MIRLRSEYELYIYAVGQATYAWAVLESLLDMLVAVIFNGHGGHPKHPEIPRALSRKIFYLQDAATLDKLKPWSERLKDLVGKVSNLSDRRHDAVHGVTTFRVGDPKGDLVRVLYTKTMHRIPEGRTITAEDVSALATEVTALASLIFRLVEEVFGALDVDNNAAG